MMQGFEAMYVVFWTRVGLNPIVGPAFVGFGELFEGVGGA
jgi:hypothetical protein